MPYFGKTVDFVVASSCALEALGVATVLVQVRRLALLLCNMLMHFAQAIADHFDV